MSDISGFDIQVEDFEAAAPAFTQAADDLSSSLDQIRPGLEGLGSFWGSKVHGPEFGAAYSSMAEKLLHLAEISQIGLAAIGDGFGKMAKQYRITEESNADSFRFGREQ